MYGATPSLCRVHACLALVGQQHVGLGTEHAWYEPDSQSQYVIIVKYHIFEADESAPETSHHCWQHFNF